MTSKWLRRNHGRVVHPIEILAQLAQTHDFPEQAYGGLEEKGHLIPQAYHDGQTDAVRIFFPGRTSLDKIERKEELPKGYLLNRLLSLHAKGEADISFLGVSPETVSKLKEDRYISGTNGLVRLGKSGERILSSRGLI